MVNVPDPQTLQETKAPDQVLLCDLWDAVPELERIPDLTGISPMRAYLQGFIAGREAVSEVAA